MKRKIKYIIFGSDAEWVKFSLSDIICMNNVIFIAGIHGLQKKIIILTFLLHKYLGISYKVNKIFFSLFFKKKWIKATETPVFWFFEQNIMSYNREFILYLKKLYPDSKIVFYFTNAIGKGNPLALNIIQKSFLYDMIVTYNKQDAKTYKFTYYQQLYSAISESNNTEKEYDLYFIGLDKGRLELIDLIAEKCENNNISYNFNIIGNNSEKIPYVDIMNNVRKSRCILELIPNGVQACTLRTAEAIACKTKLLTNNTSLKKDEVYNETQMSIFTSTDNIDMSFLKKDVNTNLFNNLNTLSPKYFLQFWEERLFN